MTAHLTIICFGWDLALLWMRSSQLIRAADYQCHSPGFDPSILWHSGIWGAEDEQYGYWITYIKLTKKFKKYPFVGLVAPTFINYFICRRPRSSLLIVPKCKSLLSITSTKYSPYGSRNRVRKEGEGWWGGGDGHHKNNLLLRIGKINMEKFQMILPGISERIISGSRLMPSTSPRWWSSSSMLLPITSTQNYDMSGNIMESKKAWDINQSENYHVSVDLELHIKK